MWLKGIALFCVVLAVLILCACGGGPDEEEAPKYHVPETPADCTTTYPCQAK